MRRRPRDEAIRFTANGITVLRLTNKKDRHGHIIPPECYVKIPDRPVRVSFNHEGNPVGNATVRREGNKLVADIKVVSTMPNGVEALRLMRLLYPSIGFKIIDAIENKILAIEITDLGLVSGGNADPKIQPLGEKVFCDSAKRDLH